MEKREYLVQLEIKGAEAIVQERVVFIQNDAASGRLRLLITMNSEPYPLEGLSGEIAFLRPDGKVIIGSLTFDERITTYRAASYTARAQLIFRLISMTAPAGLPAPASPYM